MKTVRQLFLSLCANQRLRGSLFILCLLLLAGAGSRALAANATLSNGGAKMTILGIGNSALLGGAITDPENDGNEGAGDTDPSWNWKSIFSNSEPGFDGTPVGTSPAGTERSYNVFDHLVDGGGAAKWCCGEPIASGAALATTPLQITVQMKDKYRLTHFTLTSGNDTPTRDPRDWQILGSNDGATYEPIFTQIGGAITGQTTTTNTALSLWGNDRLLVVDFTLTNPSRAYTYFRFQCTATYIAGTGAFFQISEIEYFGLLGGAESAEVVGTGTASLIKGDVTDPENNGDKAAGATSPTWNWAAVTANNKAAFGTDGAFNVFDNAIGTTNKWCCDDATAASPLNVTVEFPKGVILTHLTISSADDVTGAPTKFQILGSNDGTTFTPIYTRDNATSLWTTSNQVVRIDLKDPTPLYKFVRYEATETPGPTHQIGEIEYFGKYGGLSNPIISDVNAAASFFQFQVTDGADTKLDPTSVQLLIDNTNAPTTLSKTGAVTTIFHAQSPLFASGSTHTYALTAKDDAGNFLSRSGSVTLATYTTINSAFALASADTSKPGFRVRPYQLSINRNPGTGVVPNAERQIAAGYIDSSTGQPYPNMADLSGATDNGYFVFPGVFNVTGNDGGGAGNFPNEDPAPGIGPNGTDSYVMSIETILDLKAGLYRFGVNSDDGFRLSFGRGPGDVIGTQLATAGDRGATDSFADVVITADGFYPVRLMWFETGGGSACEFFVRDIASGVNTLLNDLAAASPIKAYRESTVSRPYISKVLPAVNYAYAFADQDVVVEITDGAITVDPATIKMFLNNNAQTLTAPAKAGKVTTVKRTGGLANLLASGANNMSVVYGFTEGGSAVLVTNNYTFTVPAYTRPIPPANKVTAAQVSGSGFHVTKAYEIDRSKDANQGNGGRHTGNNMPGPETELIGGYIDPVTGQPFPNLIDFSLANPDKSWDVPDILNANHNTGAGLAANAANSGVFNQDGTISGLPGTGSSNQGLDNSVHEYITYLDLKAGAHLFGINVDDGFTITSAPNPRDTLGTLVGFKNAPGGNGGSPLPAAAAFSMIVPEAGIYPFRLLFWEGGGGVNIEFLSVDRDTGSQSLVNDLGGTYPSTVGNSGNLVSPYTAYNTYTGPTRPWVKFSVYPMPYIFAASGANTAVTSPLVNGNVTPTLWQNRDQQSGPGPITRKLGLLNGSWNAGEVQNQSTAQRPFGDAVGAVIADLGTGTVGMVLDGTNVTATVTDIAGTTDKLVLYKPPTPLAPATVHSAGLVYAGTTNYWLFTVITNVTAAASDVVPASSVDQTARGFHVKVVQSTTARPAGNTAAAAEAQLAGTPANVAAAGPNADGSYTLTGVINWSDRKNTGGSGVEIGNFQTLMGGPVDDPIPGIPGTGAALDNVAAEIFAYLDLPAGYQKFGITGDDGWKVQIGQPGQTNGTVLFTIDRGAGAQDLPFAFITPQAGLYPVRLVWYEGGGDGNLEFFTYGPNNTKILVNSNDPNAVKAYYKGTGGGGGNPTIAIAAATGGNVKITYTGTLQSTATLSPPAWANVPSATSPFTTAASTAQSYYRTVNP